MRRLIVAAGSLELERWVSGLLKASPWLSLTSTNEIRIDWEEAVTRMEHDGVLRRGARDQLTRWLGQFLAHLPWNLLDATRNPVNHSRSDGSRKVRIATSHALLEEHTREVLGRFADQLETLRTALSEDFRKVKTGHVYRDAYELDHVLSKLQSIASRARASGSEAVTEIEFNLGSHFQTASDIVREAYGVGDRYDYAWDRAHHYDYSLICLSRRIVKARLEIFDLLLKDSKTDAPWDNAALLPTEIRRLGRLVRELGERTRIASREKRRDFISTQTVLWLTLGRGEKQAWRLDKANTTLNPEEILVEAILMALPAWETLRRLLPRKDCVDALVSARQAITCVEKHLGKIQKAKSEDGASVAQDLITAIDWLIERTPLVTLFASGILASYPLPKSHAAKWGICLGPSLVSSFVCREALGMLPLTWVGRGNEGEDTPANEEVTSEASSALKGERGEIASLGHLAWLSVLRGAG